MPRQLMAKFNCSRCKREWFKEYSQEEKLADPPSIELKLALGSGRDSLLVKFDELCEECTSTVKKYCELIAKVLKGKSPQRGAKKEAAEATSPRGPTPPSAPAPGTSRGRGPSG